MERLSKMKAPEKGKMRVVRVRTAGGVFRRAGYKFDGTNKDIPAAELTDAKFDQLANEPKLLVQVIDVEDPNYREQQEPLKKT